MKYGWPTYTAVDCVWFAFEVEKTIANAHQTKQHLESLDPK